MHIHTPPYHVTVTWDGVLYPFTGTPVEEHEVLVVECNNRSSLSTSEEGVFESRSESVGSSQISASSTSKLI